MRNAKAEAQTKGDAMNASETIHIVIESCMRPSGAYAKSRGRFVEEEKAIAFALSIGWEGPGHGIQRDREITVMRRTVDAKGKFSRETVFRRELPNCFDWRTNPKTIGGFV